MKPVNINQYKHYFIDEFGNVFNSSLNKIKSVKNKKNGYMQIMLQNKVEGLKPKLFYVHRLVAFTYIDNVNNYPQVNHKDYDKLNNHVSNLEWVTNKQNYEHAIPKIRKIINDSRIERENIILLNDNLLDSGIEAYLKTAMLKYPANIWNCSEGYARKILILKNIPIFKNNKVLPLYVKKEVADLLSKYPNYKSNYFIEYVKRKHNIKLTRATFFKIKRDKNYINYCSIT